MDRFTWGVVAGVLLIATVAFGLVVAHRVPEAPPDLATADGTVRAYIAAIQEQRAADAWRLLESPTAVQGPGGPFGARMTEEDFQRQVNSVSRPNNRRLRVLAPRQTGDATTVDVEIVTSSNSPFFFEGGASSRRVSFTLRQVGGEWRITAAPSVWEIG